MRRIKVCFCIPAFSDGGAQRQCIYLLNELQSRDDIDLVLVRNGRGVHDGLLRTDHLQLRSIETRSNYDPRVLLNLMKAIRQTKPDVLISWLHAADVYSSIVRLRFPRLRWVITERDSHYPNELKYRVRRRLGRKAHAVVSNSQAGDDYWAEAGSTGLRFVVNNIVHERATEHLDSYDRPTIVFVGRLELQKNALVTVRAFCLVAASRPDLRFQLVGDGSLYRAVIDLIADAKLEKRIEVLGFRHDARELIERAAMIVSLSEHEGSPNVLLEATAAGTVIIASAIPAHMELLGATYKYLVHDWHDVSEAARAIEEAIQDPNATEELTFARDRLAQMTPRAVAESYVRIFGAAL